MKTCTRCKTEKTLSDFTRKKSRKDGLDGWCKACNNATEKARREASPEKVLARHTAYREKNWQMLVASKKAWRDANQLKCTEATKRWQLANQHRVAANKKAWNEANPESGRVYAHTRRALKHASNGTHTIADVRRLLVLQKGKCVCCKAGINDEYHVDHIYPLAKGGGNGADNIQLLCPTCNRQKHAKHPIDFMQSRGMLL